MDRILDVLLDRKGKQVLALLETFQDRLRPADVENIRDSVEFNEWGNGFEILCTQLYEWSSPISRKEYDELKDFAQSVSEEWKFISLEELIIE